MKMVQAPSPSPSSAPPAVEDFSSNLLDELQAQTLNQLSSSEREQILYEVHGVADVVEEEPSFVQRMLTKLDEAILRLSRNSAYEQATLLSPDYVENVEFRLQFLRGDAFDVKTAAGRMISYFESKLELFGPENLTKDITLRDLDEDSLNCLKTGFMQPLPIRDKSGRAIFCSCPALIGNHVFPIQNRVRALVSSLSSMVKIPVIQFFSTKLLTLCTF
jgi:hypothetical protein